MKFSYQVFTMTAVAALSIGADNALAGDYKPSTLHMGQRVPVPMIARYATYKEYEAAEHERYACPNKMWKDYDARERTEIGCQDFKTDVESGGLRKYYLKTVLDDSESGKTHRYYQTFPNLKEPPEPAE